MPERQVLCSHCLQAVPESCCYVIPFYNADAGGYVTSFGCERCWDPTLAETRTRLAITDDSAEIASAAEFFKNHHVFLHEYLRGDPVPVVRERLVQMLDLLRSGALRLPIGPTRPLD